MIPPPTRSALLARHERLQLVPVPVPLAGGAVGIVGARAKALAVARGLVCQAAVLHGPADVTVAVLTEPDRAGDWDWAKWLPHGRDARSGGARRTVAATPAAVAALSAELAEPAQPSERFALAVLDGDALIEGRGALGRALLRSGERVTGVVLARSLERLPAACTTVIEIGAEGAEGAIRRPQAGEHTEAVLVAGHDEPTARDMRAGLARFEDPDLRLPGGALPDAVALTPLLGPGQPDAEQLRERWDRHAPALGARRQLRAGRGRPVRRRSGRDGPHGLIAGTTGAGKSELLRSFVAALAAAHPPERVNFVLIDYKGGSAFAQCGALPHTVGLVTDLDEQLGERALESLEAELRHRERVLREHASADLVEYDRRVAEGRAEPLPRLLVIIDEFATLAAELPDFIAALVGVAQRGPLASASICCSPPSAHPARSTRTSAPTPTCASACVCRRRPTRPTSSTTRPQRSFPATSPAARMFGWARASSSRSRSRWSPARTQRAEHRAIDAGAPSLSRRRQPAAARLRRPRQPLGPRASGGRRPRRPRGRGRRPAGPGWSRSHRASISRTPARSGPGPAAGRRPRRRGRRSALADDPRAQSQYPVGWNLNAGNLLLYGVVGSGVTTALATVALSLAAARRRRPRAHLRPRLRRRRAGRPGRPPPRRRGDRRGRAGTPAAAAAPAARRAGRCAAA